MNKQQRAGLNWRVRPLARAIQATVAGLMAAGLTVPLHAQVPFSALPTGLRSDHATAITVGNSMTVNQHVNKAILDWQTFNIGRDASVQFVQPSAQSVALNRIGDGSASQIFGRLSANGTLYLINNNGILFGEGSQVNVHGLTASTLNIDANRFQAGSLTQPIAEGRAALEGGSAAGAAVVVGQGAKIVTDSGGQVLMFAPTVRNEGEIHTPDGQTLLAAGQDRVYLMASELDSDLRGLLVEVGTGGDVTNVGTIVAERGNVTLLGLAVNQSGRIAATTSVDVNGSIRLIARDNASAVARNGTSATRFADAQFLDSTDEITATSPDYLPLATRAGTVTFGAGSVTEVTADTSGKTAVDAAAQPRSRVQAMGQTIALEAGARIIAKSGHVDLVATTRPDQPPTASMVPAGAGRIHLAEGSHIDVSGEHVELPVERRVIEVELRGDQLKDAPLQRDGVLRGKKVKVDIREGSPLIADMAPELARIQKGVRERMTSGGAINLRSAGDVVMTAGTQLDISGGSISYADGLVATTKLMSNGRIYDIGAADPNRIYQDPLGVHREVHTKWGERFFGNNSLASAGTWKEGYRVGAAGGALDIDAQALYGFDRAVLDAATLIGTYQREASARPAGSRLAIDVGHGELVQNIVLGKAPLSDSLGLDAPAVHGSGRELLLSTDSLNRSGLGSLAVTTQGRVHIAADADLQMGAGSSVTARGTAVDVEGRVRIAGGDVDLGTVPARSNSDGFGNYPLRVAAGAVIDVSGVWTNDRQPAGSARLQTPITVNGGNITLGGPGDVTVEAGARLRADAGAYLGNDLKLSGGNGGRIALATSARSAADLGSILSIADGVLSAYGFDTGGVLSLTANRIVIGDSEDDPRSLALSPAFFQQGFGSYNLNANMGGIRVADGTLLQLTQRNLLLTSNNASQHATGTDLATLTALTALRDEFRQPVNLSLSSRRALWVGDLGDAWLELGSGSHIVADPGAALRFSADDNIHIDGMIEAPGGDIGIELVSRSGEAYRPGLAIWFGAGARLLAPAATEARYDARGLQLADVFDGGRISVTARRGSIVAEPGAVFDVSGAGFELDMPRFVDGGGLISYRRSRVNAAAGAIDFTAAEALLVHASLRGHASGDGLGGSLSFRLNTSDRAADINFPFPESDARMEVYATLPAWDDALRFGAALPAGLRRSAQVSADAVTEGGFASLTLGAANIRGAANGALAGYGRIHFAEDLQLQLADTLWLDATVIDVGSHDVSLAASSVWLGQDDNEASVAQRTSIVQTGSGLLEIGANFIEVMGNLAIGGAERMGLRSNGDVRLRSHIGMERDENNEEHPRVLAPAMLTVAGDLELTAAQIYPTTLTDYTIALTGADSVFRTFSTGARSPILSAGGTLRVHAPIIEHGGVLAAPLGQLLLGNASTTSVRLLAGSMLDVSAEQLIPFGRLRGGDLGWIYPIATDYPLVIDSPPEKRVEITADQVVMDAGATVDLSGGGDIYAFEFVPGPGGSKDFLDVANAGGAFAVVPWLGSEISPYDTVEMAGSNLVVGQVIYLEASGGLPAGRYAVLPAHYALLPGAYLISPTGSAWNQGQRGATLDGTAIVAGRFGRAFSGQYESQWHAYTVETGAAARSRSEFNEGVGNEFFDPDKVDRAVDAGRMVVDAGTRLELNGVIGAVSQSGRGAQLDIIADAIAVVERAGEAADGAVELVASALNGLGVDSLLLGGRRTRSGTDTLIDVGADSVTIGAGAELMLPDLLLAATDTVQLESGATLRSTGTSRVGTERLLVEGDGALLRASRGEQADVVRTGVTAGGGRLLIDEGARIEGAASVLLDATAELSLAGELRLDDGSLNLTANRISLGDVPASADGVAFDAAALARLGAAELRLSSRSTIDFHGDVDFANQRVELNAGTLRGFGDGNATVRAADSLQLSNSGGVAAESATGIGQLHLAAKRIELGNDRDRGTTMVLNGFETVQLGADGLTQEVFGQGEFTLAVDGGMAVVADRVTVASGGSTLLDVGGAATIRRAGAEAAAKAVPLGGSLAIDAASISQGGVLDLAGGRLALRADQGDVALLAGSLTSVAGRSFATPQGWQHSGGGAVVIDSAGGNVTAAEGAVVAVGGGERGGDAGELTVGARQGVLDWRGDINATVAAGSRGGSLELAAADLGDVGGWLDRIAVAGIDQRVSLRASQGDLLIDRNLSAVEVAVSADAGSLTLTATIDASGERGGRVSLHAEDDLTVAGGARIDAAAATADGRGGRVELGSAEGTLRLAAGSSIDVSGRDGSLQLRATRNADNNDVAMVDEGVTVNTGAKVVLEAVRAYTSTVLDAADAQWQAALASATDFMTHADAVRARIGGIATGDNFHLRPGIEVRSDGDLTVTGTDIDFAAIRYGADPAQRWEGEPGMLTLRAAGDLVFEASLRDGLVDDPSDLTWFTPMPNKLLMNGDSWSFRATAGADLAGAAPGALAAAGDLHLVNGADLITGAADIELAAAGDLVADQLDTVIASLGRSEYAEAGVGPYDGLNFGGWLPDTGSIESSLMVWATNYKRLLYPEQGGDVSLRAGGDVRFAEPGTNRHAFSDWMMRMGGDNFADLLAGIGPEFSATTWGVWVSYFAYGDQWNGGASNAQGVAVLGGGDLHVSAGGDVFHLNAALPVTGKQVGATASGNIPGNLPTAYPTENVVEVIGGGDLSLRAGGDVLSPQLWVDRGEAMVSAGGGIGAATGSPAAVLVLADTLLRASARTDLVVDAVFNSTVMPQSELLNPIPGGALAAENYFFTYSDDATVALTSTGGDIELRHDARAVLATMAPRLAQRTSNGGADALALSLYPGNLVASALSGDLQLGGTTTLFPTPRGELRLFASGDIVGTGTDALSVLNQVDFPRDRLASWQAPAAAWLISGASDRTADTGAAAPLIGARQPQSLHTPIRTGDREPVWITALMGDISRLNLSLTKQSRLYAGRDVDDVALRIQHPTDDAISEVVAGRDINYPLNLLDNGRMEATLGNIQVAGPGRLDVIAGRDINLNLSPGIESVGDIYNAALGENGADITVMVGINDATAVTDETLYTRFADRYLSEIDNLGGSFIDWFAAGGYGGYSIELVSVFTGRSYDTLAAAMADFNALPALTRQAISLEAYQQLKAMAQEFANNADQYGSMGGYTPSYTAELVNFVSLDRFGGDLRAAVTAVTGVPYASRQDAAAALARLPVAQQHAIARQALAQAPLVERRELVLDTLMAEVRKGGIEDAKNLIGRNQLDGFERSDQAIAAMFPGENWQGRLDLAFSTVRTLDGGDINLFAPGGPVDVGLAGSFAGISKSAGELGIVTQRHGAINAVVRDSINVNQSRIFSLDGAPITLWSSSGDIDAGKGAKTALSAPQPRTVLNEDGSITLEFPPAVAGSGIQSASNLFLRPADRGPLRYDAEGFPSGNNDTLVDRQRFFRSLAKANVYLFAPGGVINAGDAGISVGGNLLAAAQQIVGADNISVGGVSIGVPTTVAVSSATLSLGDSASTVTESATSSMNSALEQTAAALAERAVAFVTVDIIGLGQ